MAAPSVPPPSPASVRQGSCGDEGKSPCRYLAVGEIVEVVRTRGIRITPKVLTSSAAHHLNHRYALYAVLDVVVSRVPDPLYRKLLLPCYDSPTLRTVRLYHHPYPSLSWSLVGLPFISFPLSIHNDSMMRSTVSHCALWLTPHLRCPDRGVWKMEASDCNSALR